uniref:hypothetical protein n=1 Tax=uncultured Tenacibaculum sp. TaxID=174713 RepID=UPI00261E3B6B|nr:hypothetical protein [uncultured Tenacibaculum sp.]
MKLKLKKRTTRVRRNKKVKFLFLPIIHQGYFYWLEKVEITKNFNGYKYQTTTIKSLKNNIEKENEKQVDDKQKLIILQPQA